MEEESLKAITNHPWLIPMLKSKLFYEECSEHASDSKHDTKKRIFFCCDCKTHPFCEHCKLNKHNVHNVIQTYRSSYQSGVRVETISKFIDTSDIFFYMINSRKIVYINQRHETEQPYGKNSFKKNVIRQCEACRWELNSASSAKYCSIECKFKNDLGSKLDELMEKKEIESQTGVSEPLEKQKREDFEVPEPLRKHRRKGSPRRAPFF